jgi:hypothetical protein
MTVLIRVVTVTFSECFIVSRPVHLQLKGITFDVLPLSSSALPSSYIYIYGLDDRGCRVRFPTGAGNFSLHHRIQNASGAHPASYPMGTRGSFPGGKAAGA